jgi:hypothetical protein
MAYNASTAVNDTFVEKLSLEKPRSEERDKCKVSTAVRHYLPRPRKSRPRKSIISSIPQLRYRVSRWHECRRDGRDKDMSPSLSLDGRMPMGASLVDTKQNVNAQQKRLAIAQPFALRLVAANL